MGESDGSDRPLADVLLEIAGSAREEGTRPAQWAHFQTLLREIAAARPGQAVNVLETGFNAGLSAAAFLAASPQVHVVSFDRADEPWVTECWEHLRTRVPGRLHLVIGESQDTMPRFAAEAGPRFDLLFIDAGHDRVECRADVLNARALAAPHALVVVDDLLPNTVWGAGVWQAWEELLREGVLTAPRMFGSRPGAATAEADAGEPPETYERRWGVARFA